MSRRPVTGLLCLVALGALSACGTGQSAQTYQAHSYDYVNADQGGIAIRNLAVDAPAGESGLIAKGGTARASGTLVSQTDVDDVLTGVTSPDADSTTLEQGGSSASSVPVPKLGRAADWAIVLTGTHRDLRGGSVVTVTLSFAKAGRTTLQIPVRSNGATGPGGGQPSGEASTGATPSPATPTPAAS